MEPRLLVTVWSVFSNKLNWKSFLHCNWEHFHFPCIYCFNSLRRNIHSTLLSIFFSYKNNFGMFRFSFELYFLYRPHIKCSLFARALPIYYFCSFNHMIWIWIFIPSMHVFIHYNLQFFFSIFFSFIPFFFLHFCH